MSFSLNCKVSTPTAPPTALISWLATLASFLSINEALVNCTNNLASGCVLRTSFTFLQALISTQRSIFSSNLCFLATAINWSGVSTVLSASDNGKRKYTSKKSLRSLLISYIGWNVSSKRLLVMASINDSASA